LAVAFSGYHGQDLVHLSGRESAHRTKINPGVFVFMGRSNLDLNVSLFANEQSESSARSFHGGSG
jgi:hypothetical protein